MAPQGAQDQGCVREGIESVHRWFLDAKDAGRFPGMSPSLTDGSGGSQGVTQRSSYDTPRVGLWGV